MILIIELFVNRWAFAVENFQVQPRSPPIFGCLRRPVPGFGELGVVARKIVVNDLRKIDVPRWYGSWDAPWPRPFVFPCHPIGEFAYRAIRIAVPFSWK